MNRDALAWADIALRYERENIELRKVITRLLFLVAEREERREELLAFGKIAIAARFQEGRRAA
jgi:hypothetical protein